MDAEHPTELSQLDPTTCMTMLTTQHVGRLVFAGDDPEIIPIDYQAVDGAITFRTRPDGRAAQTSPGPFVFEVDMFDERTRSGWRCPRRTTADGACSARAGRCSALRTPIRNS